MLCGSFALNREGFMDNVGYYNGRTGKIEELYIPMTDRAIYFGDGVYDAVMCRNNIPYLLDTHIERLFKNCERLDIKAPHSREEIKDIICELVKKCKSEEKFVYFHISRGSAIREHSYESLKGNLLITVTKRETQAIKEKMITCTTKDVRYELCDIKTLNLLPSVISAQMAKNKGCEEAIMYRNELFVTEGSHSNVSILKNGALITAPCDKYILPGVTRAHLIMYAKKYRIPIEERRYSINELINADEIIISSSSKLARGVSYIDGRAVGGKDEHTLSILQSAIYNDYISATTV